MTQIARHHVERMPVALDRTTAITVAEALALPALQRGLPEVLTGHAQLERPIRWVHAGEVPNIATLLVGGELLLTTGMGLAHRASEQRAFISDLAERGVAALVIELGSSLQAIPEPVRSAAAAAELPLVVLHREVPFVRVTEAIHTELVSRQYGLLRTGEEIKERLIAVMLDGDGLPELLDTLSRIVGNPVFLQAAGGQMLFHAGQGDDLEAWESAGAETGLERPVPMGPGGQPGRLVVLPTRRRATELDQIALRHAAGIVALALLRAREEDELLARERGNLLGELADRTVTGERAARRAQDMGFRPHDAQLLAIAIEELPRDPDSVRRPRRRWAAARAGGAGPRPALGRRGPRAWRDRRSRRRGHRANLVATPAGNPHGARHRRPGRLGGRRPRAADRAADRGRGDAAGRAAMARRP
jgi:purine catabolism regulator